MLVDRLSWPWLCKRQVVGFSRVHSVNHFFFKYVSIFVNYPLILSIIFFFKYVNIFVNNPLILSIILLVYFLLNFCSIVMYYFNQFNHIANLGHTKLMSCSTGSPLWFLPISYLFIFLNPEKIISGPVFSVYFVSSKHFRFVFFRCQAL